MNDEELTMIMAFKIFIYMSGELNSIDIRNFVKTREVWVIDMH